MHVKTDCLFFFLFFLIVCFTSYFVFRIAVLPHSPGVVYYCLLLRRETRIPGVAPFSFRIGIWDLFVHMGTEILYSHSLWKVVDHSRSKMHETCLIIIHDPGMRPGPVYYFILKKKKSNASSHTLCLNL